MKKPILLLIIMAVAIVSVSAGLITYYGKQTATLEVQQSITVSDGETTLTELFSGNPPVLGEIITATNNAPFDVNVVISDDNTESEIGVSYVGELLLTEKTVDFGAAVWEIPADAETAKVRYTVKGNEFTAEVIDGQKEGYRLIYYKDNSDRYNSPAKAILIGEVSGNLPYVDDKNNDEYDYCATGEYDTCHGAKIWYVPETTINADDTINWGRASEFLYETTLIQFNSDGKITIYPESSIGIKPSFTIGDVAGTYVITTSINPE